MVCLFFIYFQLLDACVNNCGKTFHLEVASRDFETEFRKLLNRSQPPVAEKLRRLLKKWAEGDFKNDPQLNLIPSLYAKLKQEGVDFSAHSDAVKLIYLCVCVCVCVCVCMTWNEKIKKIKIVNWEGKPSWFIFKMSSMLFLEDSLFVKRNYLSPLFLIFHLFKICFEVFKETKKGCVYTVSTMKRIQNFA